MPQPNNDTTDLNKLLEHFRARGIAVGTIELQRLQNIFAQSPSLSWEEFRQLLCAILAKDDDQRRIIKRLFEQLIPYTPDEDGQSEENKTKKLSKTGGVGNRDKTDTLENIEEETPEPKPLKQPIDVWK